MRNKTLSEVLALGAAPGRGLKATVGDWLGQTIRLTDGDFWSAWLAGNNWSGQTVNTRSALQLSAAWACVRLISETLSTLPIGLYRSPPDGEKELATNHQLYQLLRTQPNAYMSAVDFWQAYLASLLLWGNAYAEKRTSAGGIITSIDFLNPERVSRRLLKSGAIEWKYNDPATGQDRIITEAAMWHTPAFTLDGQVGVSPIRMGANVIGGAIAADKASAHTFSSGMKSSGLVTTGATVLKPDQREDIRQHVKKVSDAGGVMVLEMGEPVRILDVAQTLIRMSGRRDVDIVFTGLRPGEKLTERLFGDEESRRPTEHPLVTSVRVPPLDPAPLPREVRGTRLQTLQRFAATMSTWSEASESSQSSGSAPSSRPSGADADGHGLRPSGPAEQRPRGLEHDA